MASDTPDLAAMARELINLRAKATQQIWIYDPRVRCSAIYPSDDGTETTCFHEVERFIFYSEWPPDEQHDADGAFVVHAANSAAPVARWALQLEAVIKDDCETEAKARKIAASVLGEAKANGDGYGVPNVADLMEMMRERVAELEAALRGTLKAWLYEAHQCDGIMEQHFGVLGEAERLLMGPLCDECGSWARVGDQWLYPHHPNCSKKESPT